MHHLWLEFIPQARALVPSQLLFQVDIQMTEITVT
jgi:hypothetical protein